MGKAPVRKQWKYSTGTEPAVKNALLELLKRKPLSEIGVSELAREARVSRSTFYEHFGSPADVYAALVADVSSEISPIMDQVACTRDGEGKGRPFCACVRDDGPLASVIDDERFLREFLSDRKGLEKHDLFGLLADAGYDEAQARAICTFQLAGCFYAARSCADDAEFEQVKKAIDRFILGGAAACLASKKRKGE